MSNERITEDAVDSIFRSFGYYDNEDFVVEKQQSTVVAIRSALSKAGKAGKGGVGRPEFIITSLETPDIVLVVECKAKVSQHESKNRDRPADFAVDGVLHYARALASNFTVIAVAVSGTVNHLKIDNFLMTKGEQEPKPLVATTGAIVTGIVPLTDYLQAASFDPMVQARRTKDLIAFSQELHIFMRDEAELEEKEKPLLIAGTLIALRNEVFAKTFDVYPARDLPAYWMETIKKEVEKAKLPVVKTENMTQPFTAIEVHPELRKSTKAYPKGLLNETVQMLADRVLPFLTIYHDFDVVGVFYGEFLKYTGGDGKGLGIVLTPKHVTELFSLIANVDKDDVVVDICAGTGGFLISAMVRMISTATTEDEIENIKKKQLIGVEQQATMYALAASNMILRGDGKANMHQGSCFDSGITTAVRKHKPTVGMINPPYSKSKADLHELRFVEHMLDSLVKGGIGVAIVPMSCATSPSLHKTTLMKKNTLEAVMSMPTELFSPVGVVTCIMVFTAGVAHTKSAKKTWFGYWREDGFVKAKPLGRIDLDDRWPSIRDHWIESFRNRVVHAGESTMTLVGPEDEWVAEAYMETDYSVLTAEDFDKTVLDYTLFMLKQNHTFGDE